MQTIKYAVISAAGLGSRLGLNLPKCLLEVGGRSIISYQLESLKNIPNIRMVVGFMEEKVIDHVRKIRDDILFVRNGEYTSTSNSFSLWLGTRDLRDGFLALDGDLLIPKNDFTEYIENINSKESLVAITKAKTEDAVFVDYNTQTRKIMSFTREKKFEYEWTGLAYLSGIEIEKSGKYVFNQIENILPVRGYIINCHEIDTPADLELARKNFIYEIN